MIELSCQRCGEKAGVQSFLAAAQQPCGRCGQLLMGPLSRGRRTARPAAAPGPPPGEHGTGSPAGVGLGILAGAVAGFAVVVAVGHAGPALPWAVRNAVLGALTGVLLTPVLAVSSFLSMIVLPFSLEGILGDSAWNRLATALNHRTLRPLLMPFLVFVVLPMAACGYGGSRMKPTGPSLLFTAGLGAVLLGATLGGICGSLAGKARRAG